MGSPAAPGSAENRPSLRSDGSQPRRCSSVVRGLSSPPKGREESPMNLTRLAHHQHPRPPHHELRQKEVLDSGSRPIGQVDNLYVDDDKEPSVRGCLYNGAL